MPTIAFLKPIFGPALYFRGATQNRWRIRAVIGLEESANPSTLEVAARDFTAVRLRQRLGVTLWRYDLDLPRMREGRQFHYRVGQAEWAFAVPGEEGLRLAFTSCNGAEAGDLDQPTSIERRNALWRQLAAIHRDTPFHLLLQGGDQFYADAVWRKVPALAAFLRQSRHNRQHARLSDTDNVSVHDYYFDRYLKLWSQPDLAPILACIPSLMMWDDHDIFDGWGSHPENRQSSPVYQAVFAAARETFQLFQLGKDDDEGSDGLFAVRDRHFGWCFSVEDIGLIAPDLRSTRTKRQIMSVDAWKDFEAALSGLEGCRTLLFVSSVPLINVGLQGLERLFTVLPGQQSYQDDLRDQWQSYAHRDEWLRMLRRLLDFASRNQACVVSLSGEIHLAAFGRAWDGDEKLYQLTSSGIVHPPPLRAFAWALGTLGKRKRRVEGRLFYEMMPIPGANVRYLADRNWLELQVHAGTGLRARWHAENLSDLPWFELRVPNARAVVATQIHQ